MKKDILVLSQTFNPLFTIRVGSRENATDTNIQYAIKAFYNNLYGDGHVLGIVSSGTSVSVNTKEGRLFLNWTFITSVEV